MLTYLRNCTLTCYEDDTFILKLKVYMTDQCELSERAREYLKIKLAECKLILKKTKRKRRIIKILGTSVVVASITICAVVASVALPPLAVSILSISSGILTGLTLTFNFKYKKYEITKLIEKLNQIRVKLDYVISCNGNLAIDEYKDILKDFSCYLI